jgi:hypothetical protein
MSLSSPYQSFALARGSSEVKRTRLVAAQRSLYLSTWNISLPDVGLRSRSMNEGWLFLLVTVKVSTVPTGATYRPTVLFVHITVNHLYQEEMNSYPIKFYRCSDTIVTEPVK